MTATRAAVYLRAPNDELYWVAAQASPRHRRCLQVALAVPYLAAGSTVDVRDHALVAGSGAVLDFSASPVWQAPLQPGTVVDGSLLPGLVLSFYRQFTDRLPPTGLGVLIPGILQRCGFRNVPSPAGPERLSARAAWPAVEGIVRAGLVQDFDLLLANARPLVGLGEGLTPSGDDFLGGFFFCIHLLRRVYPFAPGLADWNYSDFILACKPLTNLVSFTLMKDHADGHALEPLHYFANGLLSGEPVNRLLPHAAALAAVGHTTGWDTLTGFLAGMCISLVPSPFNPERNPYGHQTEDRKSQ